jgi:hypothetical protein
MVLILTQDVSLFEGVTQRSATPAMIELHEDRFILFKYVGPGSYDTEIVVDTPLAALTVGGSMATLTFTVAGTKRRVDFSPMARSALQDKVSGLFWAAAFIRNSGIEKWLHEFRARQVPVRYISMRHIAIISVLSTAVVVAAAIVYAVAIGSNVT